MNPDMNPETTLDRVIRLAETGQQLGVRSTYEQDGIAIYGAVGIQFHGGKYRVCFDEIEVERMSEDEYRTDVGISFCDVVDALAWIDRNTPFMAMNLLSLKGQKVFNPAFVE